MRAIQRISLLCAVATVGCVAALAGEIGPGPQTDPIVVDKSYATIKDGTNTQGTTAPSLTVSQSNVFVGVDGVDAGNTREVLSTTTGGVQINNDSYVGTGPTTTAPLSKMSTIKAVGDPQTFTTQSETMLDLSEGSMKIEGFAATTLNGSIVAGLDKDTGDTSTKLTIDGPADSITDIGATALIQYDAMLQQALADGTALADQVLMTTTQASDSLSRLIGTRTTALGKYTLGVDAGKKELSITKVARPVDLSETANAAASAANFRANISEMYGAEYAHSGLANAILGRTADQVEDGGVALNPALKGKTIGFAPNGAGQFNSSMLVGMGQGYGAAFAYAHPNGATKIFRVSRGLMEMSVGANVGKVNRLNQDTAMQMMSGIHNRFSQVRFADWNPVSTPVKEASCGPVAPVASPAPMLEEPLPEPIVSTPVADDYCEPCGNLGPLAYGNLAMLYPTDDRANRLWASALGYWDNAKQDGSFAGYKYNAGGVQLGYDRTLGDFTVGASFGYIGGKYTDKAMDSNNSKIHNYGVTVYGMYNHPSNFFATLVSGWTYADNKLQYTTAGARWREKFHSNTWHIEGRVGYDFMTQREVHNFRLSPSLGLGYITTRSSAHNAYNETIGSDTHRYGRQRLSTGYIPLQLEGEYVDCLENGAALAFAVNGGYTYLFNEKAMTGDMILNGIQHADGSLVRYSTVGRKRGHNIWNLGAGVKYIVNEWEAGAKYDFTSRHKDNSHRVYGYVGVKF